MCVSLSLSCDTNDTEENSSLCICAPLQYCCCCCCCYASKFLIKIGAPGGALGVYYPSLFLIGCLFFSSIFSPLPFPVSFDNWTTMLWSAMDCVRLCGTPGGSVSPSTLLSIQLKQQQQLQQQILLQRYQVQQQQLAQQHEQQMQVSHWHHLIFSNVSIDVNDLTKCIRVLLLLLLLLLLCVRDRNFWNRRRRQKRRPVSNVKGTKRSAYWLSRIRRSANRAQLLPPKSNKDCRCVHFFNNIHRRHRKVNLNFGFISMGHCQVNYPILCVCVCLCVQLYNVSYTFFGFWRHCSTHHNIPLFRDGRCVTRWTMRVVKKQTGKEKKRKERNFKF